MSKKLPFLTEVGLGVFLTLFMAWGYQKRLPSLEAVSLKTFDTFTKFRKSPAKTESIHLVEIDEQSVGTVGRWPWSRAIVAQLVDDIALQGAKAIGLNVFYTEDDKNDGIQEIGKLRDSYAALLKKYTPALQKKKIPTGDFNKYLEEITQATQDINGDNKLAESIEQAANVVLPMYFQPGDPKGNNLEALPDYFIKEKVNLGKAATLDKFPPSMAAVVPFAVIGNAAGAIGHSNLTPDADGAVRRVSPIIRYGDGTYPSFGVEMVRLYKDLQKDALQQSGPNELSLFTLKIPLDEDADTTLDMAGPAGSFPRHSAIDVFSDGLPEGALKNKIVLVGVTAPGSAPTYVGSSGQAYTGLEIWANHIENILNQRFISRPPWAVKAEWGFLALAGLIVFVVLPLLRARYSIPLSAMVFTLIGGSSLFLFVKNSVWISPSYGLVLLFSGFIVIVAKRLLFTEKGKEMVEAEGMETNKMLGLSFQGQGMLDLAFEKFRKCPVDESVKELLYNLGLDMERKRQFAKAAAVYEYIASVSPNYKDIKSKIELLKKAGEGAVFGAIGKKGSDSTVVVEGLSQSTTLGRYEVMKELGRGAMGIVYLGKDPKINRQVAIKTLRFEDNMDDGQIKSVKERFFREAESAGNLTHPNIIRIFDAGEDQEVAYIAMELLEGEDLKKYTEKDKLLPMPRVIEMMALVASGLDYAHKQGVVHRDIKPGNIMLLKDGTLRITDFGIARIQATSKTATGAVLGTPAYMSPEQVNGKKVDGRADIFSLGVTLYEMLTGEKPFHADSIAALLYQIANIDHPDIREFNKTIPLNVVQVINRALAKDPAQRYQTAGQMEEDLRNCLKAPAATPIPEPIAPVQSAPTPPVAPAAPVAPTPVEPEPVRTETPSADATLKVDATIDNNFISDLENAFEIKRDQTMNDIPVLPDIEATLQINPKPPEAPKS